jgi:uncharacterized protein YkwD
VRRRSVLWATVLVVGLLGIHASSDLLAAMPSPRQTTAPSPRPPQEPSSTPWWRAPLEAIGLKGDPAGVELGADLGRVLNANELARALFLRVNVIRQEQGRAPLGADARLSDVALMHARDMAREAYFSHRSKDGRTSGERLAGRYPEHVGAFAENIYRILSYRSIRAVREERTVRSGGDEPYTVATVAERIVDGWMGSPGHRDNLLRREMNRVGHGVVVTGDDIYVTQLFSRPIVILERALPASFAAGSRVTISMYLGVDLAHESQVDALLVWPDKRRRFRVGGGRYLEGLSPVETRRTGQEVRLLLDLPPDPGRYRLRIGSGERFYDIGVFRVR